MNPVRERVSEEVLASVLEEWFPEIEKRTEQKKEAFFVSGFTQTKKTVNTDQWKRMGVSVTESSLFSNCFERPQDF